MRRIRMSKPKVLNEESEYYAIRLDKVDKKGKREDRYYAGGYLATPLTVKIPNNRCMVIPLVDRNKELAKEDILKIDPNRNPTLVKIVYKGEYVVTEV